MKKYVVNISGSHDVELTSLELLKWEINNVDVIGDTAFFNVDGTFVSMFNDFFKEVYGEGPYGIGFKTNNKMKMNIFAINGHKVKFTNPEAGYPFDQKMGKEHLEIGKEYTVDYTEVEDYSTNVVLQEIPKIKFNSVLFSDVVEQGVELDVKHADYCRYHKCESTLQAIDVIRVVKDALIKEYGNDVISPLMYDAVGFDKYVSVAFMEKVPRGMFKRFVISVKDNK
jgi:hypothetical protein